MALVEQLRAPATWPAQPVDPPPPLVARLWRLPLVVHAGVLALVLVGLLAWVGVATSSTSDEGLAIVQARSLASGHGWIVDHPLPSVDPAGAYYPLEKADRGPNGFAPLAKHPLYPLLLAAADRLGGVDAMVLLSLAGVVVAAGLSGVLAARLDPNLARPSLWVVGLASPLTHDGFLVLAHTLAAALAVGAVLVALTAFERRSVRMAFAIAPLVAGAVLLRSSGPFLALGLVAAAAVLWTRRSRLPAAERARGAVALAVAGAAAGSLIVATLAEQAWTGAILGRGVAAVHVPASGGNVFRDRVDGFLQTWLTPSYDRVAPVVLGLLVATGALVVGAWWARRGNRGHRLVLLAALVAPAGAVVALAAGPGNRVPGLLIAFPVLAVGLLLLGRADLRTTAATTAVTVSAVVAVGVIATQYKVGGGIEWGGRYFALALPIAVPVVLAALRRRSRDVAPAVRKAAIASLVVCSVAMTTMALTSLHESTQAKERLVASIDRTARATGSSRPVVVTTAFSVSALAWPSLDRAAWLHSRPSELPDLVRRLEASGIRRFVLVTPDAAQDEAVVGRSAVTATDLPVPGLSVLAVDIEQP